MTAVNDEPILLPSNVEAEQALLGAMLINNEAYHAVADFLRAEHFYDDLHRRIFTAMAELIGEGRRADIRMLPSKLPAGVKVNDFTLPQYLARLMAEATTIINAVDYGNNILEHAQRRELILISEEVIRQAADTTVSNSEAILGDTVERLMEIGAAAADQSIRTLAAAAGDAIKTSESGLAAGVLCGLLDLDRILGGFQAGDLYILAGRPSMGKSALAMELCLGVARRNNPITARPVGAGFFSLEMKDRQAGARAVTNLAYNKGYDIAYKDILSGRMSAGQREGIDRGYATLAELPVLIDDRGGLTLGQVETGARRMKAALARKGIDLGLVVVDYLQIMSAGSRYKGSPTHEIGELSGGLKAMAKRLNVPVVALSQLSRAVETRGDKRPMLADLRDSGSIEQDADTVLFVYREAYYLERKGDRSIEEDAKLLACANTVEIIIGKQRNGPTGVVEAYIHLPSSAIRNLEASRS